jgi:D-sedoheptulose 7-phosphate isomerase
MKEKIEKYLKETIGVKQELLKNQVDTLSQMAKVLIHCIRSDGKILIFGNGGSAADSQHMAAELVGRFKKERPPIAAIALSTDTSTLTALANDYGYSASFKRQLEALGRRGDAAIGISTSGNSDNVYEALLSAKKMGLKIITMTGKDGGKISGIADVAFKVPSNDTPHIQESHITAVHIVCGLIEDELFG